MSAIAIRLSCSGASVVIQKVNINFHIKTDEQFLLSMCKPHKFDMEYFAVDKFDVNVNDRFETDDEQKAVKAAFAALWNIARDNMGEYISGKGYFENIKHFQILYNYCSGFDIFEKGSM